MNQHLIAQAERLYRHLVTTGQHLEGDRHDQLALDLTEPDWPAPPPPRSGFDRWEAMHLATRVPGGLTTFTPPAELPPDVLPW